MARIVPDGNTKVHWVTTIATPSAPTVVELAAGTELTSFLARSGIDTPEEATDADSSDLSSARDKSVPATIGGQITGDFYRDDTTDTAWTTLTRLAQGYLVIGRFGGSGTDKALIATDTCEVWQVQISQRSNSRLESANTLKFTSVFSLAADPVDATIAA